MVVARGRVVAREERAPAGCRPPGAFLCRPCLEALPAGNRLVPALPRLYPPASSRRQLRTAHLARVCPVKPIQLR
jgi:hypothetical protein